MKKTTFIIRDIEPGDIVEAMKLSNAEGWNQTEMDWNLLIEKPQNACILAEYGKKIIGTTTAINYSNRIAWIGMVLVDKDYRGQGIAKSLLKNILEQSASCKSVKLDATDEGLGVYRKFDFRDEYLIARMVTTSMKNLPSADDDLLPEPIQSKHIEEIIAFDEFVFGAKRARLIESLVREYPHKGWLIIRNSSIEGFALGREGTKYSQIGPVVASTTADSKILITKALSKLSGQPIVIDVLNDKEELIDWLNSIGFVRQRQFVRMYKKENPFPGTLHKQFLICGPEFG